MQVLTIKELMRLTRTELCGLVSQITARLTRYPEGSPERLIAIRNLGKIRRILRWLDLAPDYAREKPLPARTGRGLGSAPARCERAPVFDSRGAVCVSVADEPAAPCGRNLRPPLRAPPPR
jgi:hypothetical protein